MALLQGNQGQTGKQVGSNITSGFGEYTDLLVTELMPRYYEQTYRQNSFFAASPSGVTTSVGLNATYVGLCVSNPVGNTKNLAILKITCVQPIINTAVNAFGVAVGYNASTNVTHTTAVTPRSSLFGTGPTPSALADSSATLPTAPFYYCFLTVSPTATTNPNAGFIDLEGSLIIPPGGYVMTATTAASTASGFFGSISWLEIPV